MASFDAMPITDGRYVFEARTAFYPLRYEGRYVGGMRDGLWRVVRLDTGAVTWETTWSQGRWHGRSTSYWKNGHKQHEGEHRNGLEDGVWRFWFENGTLAAEGRYDAGRKSGEWQYWDEDGNRLPYDVKTPRPHQISSACCPMRARDVVSGCRRERHTCLAREPLASSKGDGGSDEKR